MHTPTLIQTAFTAASLIAGAAALPTRRASMVEDFMPTGPPSAPASRRGSLAPQEPPSRRGSVVDALPPSRRTSFVEDGSARMNRGLMATSEDIARSRRRSVFVDDDSAPPSRRDSLAGPSEMLKRSVNDDPSMQRRSSLAAPADISRARRRSELLERPDFGADRRNNPLAASTGDIFAARKRSLAVDTGVPLSPIERRSGSAISPADILASRRRSVIESSMPGLESLSRRASTSASPIDVAAARRRSPVEPLSPMAKRSEIPSGAQDIMNARRRLFPDAQAANQPERRSSLAASSADIARSRRRSEIPVIPDADTEEDFAPIASSSDAPVFRNSFSAEPIEIYVEEAVAPEDDGSFTPSHEGVAVPIAGRADKQLSRRGVVDWDSADAHMDKLGMKYESGIIAHQKHTGRGLLGRSLIPENELKAREVALSRRSAEHRERLEDRRAIETADPEDVDDAHDNTISFEEDFMESFANEFSVGNPGMAYRAEKRETTGATTLSSYKNDLLWAGNMKVGSNGQPFTIDFDTGSADLWIPGPDCTGGCAKHHKYDPSSSTTSKKLSSGGFNIIYGDGSTTSGDIYTDTVTVGGVTGLDVPIGVASKVGSSFANDPQDGLVGLAFESISTMGQKPFIQSLLSQNQVKNGQFSFALSQNGGSELFLGGANKEKYTGSFEWHNVTSESYWVLQGTANIGGKQVVQKPFNAIIDTGTTVVVAPPDEAKQFWSNVPGAEEYGNGYWTFPCDATPDVSFAFGGQQWSMDSQHLNLGRTFAGSNMCIGSIVGIDIGIDAWIIGDSFLKNVYTSFNFDTKTVGFAKKAAEQ